MGDNFLLKIYRSLPWFRGKLRLGRILFRAVTNSKQQRSFTAHDDVRYHIPNTLENIGTELLINGVYEKDIIDFLKKKVNPGNTFFDVGANIGSIALPILKTRADIIYHGFEASPATTVILQKNMKANGFTDAVIINKAVHKDSELTLKFYEAELYGKSSLAPTYSSFYSLVNSVSLDDYCAEKEIEQIDWLKVDVQGFELHVFEGAARLLAAKKINNILFEIEGWAEDEAGIPNGAAKNFVQSVGYRLCTLAGKDWNREMEDEDTMIWAVPKD